MTGISLCPIEAANWRATLRLAVHPDQQYFVAEHTPIAAIILAKAYVRPGGLIWEPYIITADSALVGLLALAYHAHPQDQVWLFHFFIDSQYQGKGYGKAAMHAVVELVRHRFVTCQSLNLTVHPENHRAQKLYCGVGFRKRGDELYDEPVYTLMIREALDG